MTKIVALVVSVVMLLTCCAALGEEPVVNQEDFTTNLAEESKKIDFSLNEFNLASTSADKVTVDGHVYTVVSDDLTLTLDLGLFPTVLCFTQNFLASVEAYIRVDDPQAMVQQLIDNNINFYLADTETGLMNAIYPREGDKATSLLKNFSELPDSTQKTIASYMGASEVLKAGDTAWMKVGSTNLVTIIQSKYLITEYGGTDDAEGDLQDTLDILSHLKLQ